MFFAYTRPRDQVSVYRTIGHLVISRIVHQYVSLLRNFGNTHLKRIHLIRNYVFAFIYINHTKRNVDLILNKDNCYIFNSVLFCYVKPN